MNKNAQAGITIGIIMVAFITLLVGVILFQAVAQEAGKGSATVVSGNVTYTTAATGSSVDLTGQELLSTAIYTNVTNGTQFNQSFFTASEAVSTSTGVKTIILTSNPADDYDGNTINVSYTYGADGYIDSSGGRAIASLIAIFFALAIAVIALEPTLRSGFLDMIGK